MKNRYREERLFRRKGHCVLIVFVLLIMNSCQGYDLDTEKPSWLGSSIYEYLNDAGCYSDYVRLIDDLGYDRVLSKTGSKTLFVADDDAFQRFYRNRTWGVGSYEELSLAQKKMLFSGVMINNAHQLATLSSTEGPTEGDRSEERRVGKEC